MTDEQINKIRTFYTIEKQEFSYFSQKMVNKKHKFYHKNFLPPTYKSVMSVKREPFTRGYEL